MTATRDVRVTDSAGFTCLCQISWEIMGLFADYILSIILQDFAKINYI